MSYIRHVGKVDNTGTKIAVVMRFLPEEPNMCLIVETERLPDMYHDDIIKLINSTQAQNNMDLHPILSRSTFSDGTNMLKCLHERGHIKKISIDSVTMYVLPNQGVPLKLVNDMISGAVSPDGVAADVPVEPLTVHTADNEKSREQQAIAHLNDAKDFDRKAVACRERAYMICPEMRPSTAGRPSLTETQKEESRDKRNERRRARYSIKASGENV
jgi:hypothetical protein